MRLFHPITRFLWALIVLLGTLAIAGYVSFLAWREYGPQKPVPNAVRRELAELVLPVILDDLRLQRTSFASAVLLHLANDPTDYLTDRLRTLVVESGAFTLVEPMLDEKVQRALNLAVTSPDTLDAAVARGRGLGAPVVIFGRVEQFEGTPEAGRLALDITIADIASRQVVFTRSYRRDWKPMPLEPVVLQDRVGRTHAATRTLGWALAVLLLPIFSIRFLRATVRRGSNRANGSVLTLYTVIGAILAWLVIGATLDTVWSALVLAALTAGAFVYNVWIMTFALRLEEP